jgi:hypothetical protein
VIGGNSSAILDYDFDNNLILIYSNQNADIGSYTFSILSYTNDYSTRVGYFEFIVNIKGPFLIINAIVPYFVIDL